MGLGLQRWTAHPEGSHLLLLQIWCKQVRLVCDGSYCASSSLPLCMVSCALGLTLVVKKHKILLKESFFPKPQCG